MVASQQAFKLAKIQNLIHYFELQEIQPHGPVSPASFLFYLYISIYSPDRLYVAGCYKQNVVNRCHHYLRLRLTSCKIIEQ